MTVLNSETTRLLGSGVGVLPRVNLLPPEIAEKRAFRRIQVGLGAAVLGAVGVVALLYVGASSSVSNANEDLVEAQAQTTVLKTEVAKYNNVTAIYAAAEAAQVQLTQAMGDEIRYSQLLNDISLAVPSSVWLKSVAFTQGAAPGAAPAAAPAGTTGAAAPTVGTFTVSGIGFSHDDVALWLEAIAGLKTYSSPYFSNSTEALIGPRVTVNFASTANLTSAALSGRYTKPAGG